VCPKCVKISLDSRDTQIFNTLISSHFLGVPCGFSSVSKKICSQLVHWRLDRPSRLPTKLGAIILFRLLRLPADWPDGKRPLAVVCLAVRCCEAASPNQPFMNRAAFRERGGPQRGTNQPDAVAAKTTLKFHAEVCTSGKRSAALQRISPDRSLEGNPTVQFQSGHSLQLVSASQSPDAAWVRLWPGYVPLQILRFFRRGHPTCRLLG
jgi:hypothetical protein